MFSLENLAWRTSNEPGLTYGTIYHPVKKDLMGVGLCGSHLTIYQCNEASSANWTENNFVR